MLLKIDLYFQNWTRVSHEDSGNGSGQSGFEEHHVKFPRSVPRKFLVKYIIEDHAYHMPSLTWDKIAQHYKEEKQKRLEIGKKLKVARRTVLLQKKRK